MRLDTCNGRGSAAQRATHRSSAIHAKRAASLLAGLAACLFSVAAQAQPVVRQVSGPRVELGEVVLDAPDLMRAIDICASPAVGASLLLDRQNIERQVRAAGFDTADLSLPAAVRVSRTGRKFTPAEVSAMLEGPIKSALPAGATLLQIQSTASLSLEEGTQPGPIALPKLPRRTGSVRVAFTVEFVVAGDAPVRVPVSATLQLDSRAARSAVAQGAKVDLVIVRGAARVTAAATTLTEGDVGDELQFRVTSTGKVLRGVLVSPTSARVRD
jgi:Chaperone for flagella basal body P-ring formation